MIKFANYFTNIIKYIFSLHACRADPTGELKEGQGSIEGRTGPYLGRWTFERGGVDIGHMWEGKGQVVWGLEGRGGVQTLSVFNTT